MRSKLWIISFVLVTVFSNAVTFSVVSHQKDKIISQMADDLQTIMHSTNQEPLLTPAEAQGLVETHARQIKVQVGATSSNTKPLASLFKGLRTERYENGKWVVSVIGGEQSRWSFVVDDKTGRVTGP